MTTTTSPRTDKPLKSPSLNGSTEKVDIAHVDISDNLEEGGEAATKGDYSGFTQKTDPKEIKLVRKLDRYIMVRTDTRAASLRACYNF